jgi:aminoglycoside N3'-acetyltransferase
MTAESVFKRLAKKILGHRPEYFIRKYVDPIKPRQLAELLESLGVQQGSHVLVHSAFSSLGNFPSGPTGLIKVLQDLVGPQGTIIMQAIPYHGSMQAYVEDPPPVSFDIEKTPTVTGVIPEAFRQFSGVLRSLHPSHSVTALGNHAAAFLEGHEESETPCGPDTPWGRMAEMQVIGLRIGTGAFTYCHHIQETAEMPNLFLPELAEIPCRGYHGKSVTVRTRVYRELIPRVVFFGENVGDQLYNVHFRDFPLLYSGNRETLYRRDPRRVLALEKLIEHRSVFVKRGLLKIGTIKGCICETFPIKEYKEYAVREEKRLFAAHPHLYELPRMQRMLDEGFYPPS